MSLSPEPEDVRRRFARHYDQLRKVAEAMLRGPRADASPSDLVHDAFVHLQAEELRRMERGRSQLGQKPDSVFRACFGAACRDVLVDRRRREGAQKRGGAVAHRAAGSTIVMPGAGPVDVAVVHDALEALGAQDPLLARIAEARVFADLTVAECAEVFGISRRSVDRHWRFAKAWLAEQLR